MNLQLVLQLNLVRDLLVLLHQVQTLWHDRVVLVLILAHLHEHLDHVLDPVGDCPFVQNSTEALVYGGVRLWRVLREERANFSHEADSNLDGVVGGAFEEKEENLEGNDFVRDSLVDEVGNEGGRGMADNLHAEPQ